MIIAFDGYEANVPSRVGIGRYAFEILAHLYPLIKDSGNVVRVYLPTSPLSDMPKETAWWRYRVVGPKKFWTFVGLPIAIVSDVPRANVVFSPTHYVPRFINIPRVMSIMDLSYLYYPEMFRPKDLHQLTIWTAYSVRHARKILTISESSKRAIMKAYHVPEDRVVVTYPGITNMANPTNLQTRPPARQVTNVLEKYKIRGSYILSVGTLQPRKNFVRLIEALSLLSGDTQLVIVGKKGWLFEDILAAPQRFGVEDRVKFLDFVPDSDLPALYKGALCCALPSLYEGFGLPVLEAMAYGTQVVASNVSSLPEIAGKAGIYVDPNDTESIAKGLRTALDERDKKFGKERIALGLTQVKKFTWEKAAKQTLEVLEEVGRTR